jgi:tellurite methyltransferase
MDQNYWKDYYSKNRQNKQPSLFAKYISENYVSGKKTKLIELGCGNGRDSIYYGERGLNVLAVDQVDEEIDFLNKRFGKFKNLEFKSGDFTNLKNDEMFEIIYSRFTLHSINLVEQNRVLNWAYNQLNQNGFFCVEVRGHKNELYQKGEKVANEKDAFIYNNHYRRFLEFETFCNELLVIGFNIEYSNEAKGFAPFNDTNETFIRVIAKKIDNK